MQRIRNQQEAAVHDEDFQLAEELRRVLSVCAAHAPSQRV
jgi:hypothetical protein